MLTVSCVLRSGGSTYNANWVTRLQRNVAKHLTVPYKFVCLTNLPRIDGVETKPLTEGFPHWWSKLELFSPGKFDGPVLYMDLDLMVCGNIDQIANVRHPFVMLKDCPAFRHVANSGLMHWNPRHNNITENIFHDFKRNMITNMKEYSGKNGVTYFGDQGFIQHTLDRHGQQIQKWQDILPQEWFLEFSYLDKVNPIVANDTYNKDARICYALGHPKFPSLPDLPIVKAHWE